MEMMHDVKIDGVSARSLGLIVNQLPPVPMAAQRYAAYAVGRDEDLTVQDDSFDDIAYTVTLRIAGDPKRMDNTSLYKLIQNAKKLKLSILPKYFFRVKHVSGIVPDSKLRGNEMIYSVTFALSPWKYIDAEPDVEITGSGVVTNNGTRYCKPVYTVSLSANYGTGHLKVNGQDLTITIPEASAVSDGKIIIDADKEIAYSSTGTNMTLCTAGIFRFLAVGQNTIQCTGICTGVTIKRNGRCY